MTDFIELKNNAYRLAGRQMALWAWQGFELGCSFVLPWLVAGEMSPAKPVEAQLAATQRKLTQVTGELETIVKIAQGQQQAIVQQNLPQPGVQVIVNQQAQNNVAVGAQNPSRWAKVKDFVYASTRFGAKSAKMLLITLPVGVARGSFQAVKWVDGTISGTLGFIDEALNKRFKGIPGYRLLTWYPLRLGNWENTYKQTRNYMLVVNPLWQRFVQPFLKDKIFFDDMAKAVSSYVAPYADEGIRIADKSLIGFLSTIYSSASSFGLESFEKSFVGTWYGQSKRTMVYSTYVTVSDFFTPVKVSTVQLENAAERHIELLKSGATQAMDKLNVINGHIHGYAGPIMTLVGAMANDVYRYGDCVANTDRGFMPCTESAFSHAYTDYAQPVFGFVQQNGLKPLGNFVYQNALNPIMQFFIHNRVTGPMFYFGDCVVNGNSGYLMQTGTMLKQATTVSLSANNCPVDTVIVSGFKNCSSNAMEYMYVDYAQPFMGASWNFVCNSASTIGNGIYTGAETLLVGMGNKVVDCTYELMMLAKENPTTAAAAIATPLVGFCVYFTAKTLYERVAYPNAQHLVHHGIANQAP